METRLTAPLVFILLVSTLIPMANAVVTPVLPDIFESFKTQENARLYVDLVLALPGLAIALGSPVAGRFLDRIGPVPVLAFGLLVVGCAGAIGYLTTNLSVLLITRFFHGLSIAAILTSCTVILAGLSTELSRTKLMGWLAAAMGFGNVSGMLVGGGLGGGDWHTPFLAYCVSLLFLPGLVFVRRTYDGQNTMANTTSVQHKELDAIRTVGRAELVLYVLSFVTMSLYIMIPLYIPFLLQHMGVEGTGLKGVALGIFMMGCSVISLLYHKIRSHVGFTGVFLAVFGFSGLSTFLLSFASNYLLLVGILILGSFGWGMYIANATSYLMTLVPQSARGKAVGKLNFAFYIGQFAAPFMGGALARGVGLSATFELVGVVLLLFSSVFAIKAILERGQKSSELGIDAAE